MRKSSFLRTISVSATLLISANALAGGGGDSKYRLVAYVGGGVSQYIAAAGVPSGLQADVSKFGPAATVRVMWQPDHLLGVGLESGWTKLYSYETTQPIAGTMHLSQVPMYIVWSMKPLESFTLFGGYGYSRVNSALEYEGTVNIGTWSMGWMAACAYERPVSDRLGVAAELKWIDAMESHDAILTLQVQLVWSFLEW